MATTSYIKLHIRSDSSSRRVKGRLHHQKGSVALGTTGFANAFFDSFRELGGKDYDIAAGLRFSHISSDRAAKARDLSARTAREQAELAVANLKQLVRLDVRLAINEFELARRQVTATREFQEETLEAETQRFEVGASTALLAPQAWRDLLIRRGQNNPCIYFGKDIMYSFRKI